MSDPLAVSHELPVPRVEVESLGDLRRALARAGILARDRGQAERAAFRGAPIFEVMSVPRGHLRLVSESGAVVMSYMEVVVPLQLL